VKQGFCGLHANFHRSGAKQALDLGHAARLRIKLSPAPFGGRSLFEHEPTRACNAPNILLEA
jgi:hypothetical protein